MNHDGFYIINSKYTRETAMQHVANLSREPIMMVTIEPYSNKRSVKQNKAYWKVILKPIEDATGLPSKAWHELFKTLFVEPTFYQIKDRKIECRETTTEMTTKEFSEYIEKIRLWCIENLNGLILPEIQQPNEMTRDAA